MSQKQWEDVVCRNSSVLFSPIFGIQTDNNPELLRSLTKSSYFPWGHVGLDLSKKIYTYNSITEIRKHFFTWGISEFDIILLKNYLI